MTCSPGRIGPYLAVWGAGLQWGAGWATRLSGGVPGVGRCIVGEGVRWERGLSGGWRRGMMVTSFRISVSDYGGIRG